VRVTDLAAALINDRPVEVKVVGIRPGEKVHETLISEEECHRSFECGDFYGVRPILPELDRDPARPPAFSTEYSSALNVLSREEARALLARHQLRLEDALEDEGELLR